VSFPPAFTCPLCDRRFGDERARKLHLVESRRCNAVESLLELRYLLADREDALAVARRQRDEARAALRWPGAA
jgi:hypothetical protein